MMTKLSLATLAAALATTAAAAGGISYSHKVGVGPEEWEVDFNECAEAGRAEAVVEGSRAKGEKKGVRATRDFERIFLNCLEGRGYTQRLMPEKEWKKLKKRPFAEQKATFQALTSAPQPLHPLDPGDDGSR